MNQIFCFKRFVWLLKRQWFENATSYKWRVSLMALIVTVMLGLFLWFSSNVHSKQSELFIFMRLTTYWVIGAIFMLVHGAKFFSSLSSKNRKMFYFSLPVSPLERVAVTFSFVMIFIPVIILSVFTVCDFVAVQIFNNIYDYSTEIFFNTTFTLDSINIKYDKNLATSFDFLITFFCCSSLFALGSLIFAKKGPVITTVFLFVFCFIPGLFWEVDYETYTFPYFEFFLIPIYWIAMFFVMKRKEA